MWIPRVIPSFKRHYTMQMRTRALHRGVESRKVFKLKNHPASVMETECGAFGKGLLHKATLTKLAVIRGIFFINYSLEWRTLREMKMEFWRGLRLFEFPWINGAIFSAISWHWHDEYSEFTITSKFVLIFGVYSSDSSHLYKF